MDPKKNFSSSITLLRMIWLMEHQDLWRHFELEGSVYDCSHSAMILEIVSRMKAEGIYAMSNAKRDVAISLLKFLDDVSATAF